MKRIDLGHDAIAFETGGPEEWVDAVPEIFFREHSLTAETLGMYTNYVARVAGQSARTSPHGVDPIN